MSRIGFSQAITGRRGRGIPRSGGNGRVEAFRFDEGGRHRMIIPTYVDENGEEQIIVFGETIHRVSGGVIKIPTKKGKQTTYTFRCSHPYSQQSHDDAVKIAERREMCPLCELENLQNQARLKIMEEEIGFEEFKKLKNKEKKAFYNNNPLDVERSYYKKDIEGEEETVQTREMYILALEVKTEEVERKQKNKKTGKVRKYKDVKPVVTDGKVEYQPTLFKVSGSKMNELKTAVDNALETETLSIENTHPIIENEGTEYEEEVNVTWVDFQFKYPDKEGDRMSSAREMSVTVMPDDKSIIVNNEDFIDQVTEEMEGLYKEAHTTFNRMFKNLQLYTREEVIDMFSEDIRNEFEQLREEFRSEKDEEFEEQVYDTVLSTVEDEEDDDDDEEVESNNDEANDEIDLDEDDDEEEEVEEEEEKPKKSKKTSKTAKSKKTKSKKTKSKATKSKTKTKAKSKTKKKEDDDLDEDIDIDEEELFEI